MRNSIINKILIVFGGLVLFMLLILGGFKVYDLKHPYQAKDYTALGYSPVEVDFILTQEDVIKKELLNQPFLPFIIKHFTLEHYTDLIDLGYTDDEIESLLELDEDRLAIILENERDEQILEWVQMETFIPSRFQRYLDAHAKLDFDDMRLLEWVNADRDRPFYTDIQESDSRLGKLILVNKYYALGKDYRPSELQSIAPYGHGKLAQDAAVAFKQLASDARENGYTIVGISAYRSYQTQATLYQRYVLKDGQELADTYSARAGHSEHQTALAIDVASHDHNILSFEHSDSFVWMREHAHEYGFILRYPKGKEQITGYKYEPWHYRYVGIEVASALKKSGMTFDEYAAVNILD